MSQTLYIEQRAPWVFRSGRPFGQGGDTVSLSFPWPSTTAGAVRTWIGDQRKVDFAMAAERQDLCKIPVHGPLLARRASRALEVYLPKPADCLYLQDGKMEALGPGRMASGENMDLWETELLPVFLQSDDRSKPAAGPAWWSSEVFQRWLQGEAEALTSALGCAGPAFERRTHVAIAPDTQAAAENLLFQTEGLDFHEENVDYGLLLHLPEDGAYGAGWLRMGGDGRLGQVTVDTHGWPACEESLARDLCGTERIRLILVTPAVFGQGWLPGWLDASMEGSPPGFRDIRLRLRAALVPRWEAHSGWDLASDQPRAVRRLVPPGAVYWFQVLEGNDHLPELWLKPLSDREQDRNDGFGLAVPGLWKDKE